MGLDHQALEAQVEGLLGNLGQVLPLAAHVGRIDENGEFRIAAAELHGHLPLGNIAVTGLLIGGETAVNGTQLAYSGAVQALQRSYPQVQVRIHRILHEHRYVGVPESIRYLLHQERIAGGTGSYPDQVHSVFQALIDVLFAGNLGTDLHPEFLLYLLHPLQSGNAHALEAAGMGAGLPYSCTEHVYSLLFETCRGPHQLLFAFRAARARYHTRFGLGEEPPVPYRDRIQYLCHSIGD